MSIQVRVFGPNLPARLADRGTVHVHVAGCADIAKRYGRVCGADQGGWTATVASVKDIVADVYDPASFDYDLDDETDRAPYEADIAIFPCVHTALARAGAVA